MLRILSIDVGLRNLGVAIVRAEAGLPPHVQQLGVYDVLQECGSAAKCTSVNKLNMARYMSQFLVDHEGAWGVDTITHLVVEGQLRRAPRNVCMMMVLFGWFHGCRYRCTRAAPPMYQISARRKLEEEQKVSYYQRKKQAVDKVDALLAAAHVTMEPDAAQQFRDAKKRDDMADAVLQALWYIDARTPDGKAPKLGGKGKGKAGKGKSKAAAKDEAKAAAKGKGKGKAAAKGKAKGKAKQATK